MTLLSATDYVAARARPWQRSLNIAKPHIERGTFKWVSGLLDVLRPFNCSLQKPAGGWKENELYLTMHVPRSSLWIRVYLNTNAQGMKMGRKGIRFYLMGSPGLLWRLKHTVIERPYLNSLRRRAEVISELGQSWEPCPNHLKSMSLRVNPRNGHLEWYCVDAGCESTAHIATVLRQSVWRDTDPNFWRARKQ